MEESRLEAMKAGYFSLIPIGSYSAYTTARKKIIKYIDQSGMSDMIKLYYYCPTVRKLDSFSIDFEGEEQLELLTFIIGDISSYKTKKGLFMIQDRGEFDSPHHPEKCKVSFVFNPIEMKLRINFNYIIRSVYY